MNVICDVFKFWLPPPQSFTGIRSVHVHYLSMQIGVFVCWKLLNSMRVSFEKSLYFHILSYSYCTSILLIHKYLMRHHFAHWKTRWIQHIGQMLDIGSEFSIWKLYQMELFKKLDWKIPIVNHAQWVAKHFRDGYIFSSQWFCLLQIVFVFKYTVKCFIRIFPVVNIVVLKMIFIGCEKNDFSAYLSSKTEIKLSILLKTYLWVYYKTTNVDELRRPLVANLKLCIR